MNGPVDPKRFGIPEITAGVYVGDQRNWSGSFKGGFAARQKLDRSRAGLAQPTPSNDADKIASPVVAGNLPHGGTWEAALVAVALATFAIAWKLHRAA